MAIAARFLRVILFLNRQALLLLGDYHEAACQELPYGAVIARR
jgi:hypothetical protein